MVSQKELSDAHYAWNSISRLKKCIERTKQDLQKFEAELVEAQNTVAMFQERTGIVIVDAVSVNPLF